jgi:hypothetical protein
MSLQNEARRVGDATGLGDTVRLATNGSPITKPSRAAQQAIADLHREFVADCLRIAAIKAAHGADNILISDDITAERDIRLAVENIREAARAFREWQASVAEAERLERQA